MDSGLNDKSVVSTAGTNQKVYTDSKLPILHQNICSFQYKSTELEVLLCTVLNHVDIVCLTEHWPSYQNLKCTNITDFRLVSAFCRSSSKHGGSSIYVKSSIEAKDIYYFTTISEDKNFEMSVIELPECKLCIICIYRSPDGQFEIFLNKLELVIQKLLMKKKSLLLCGDWNIDFLHEDNNQRELVDLLLRYNLVNTVQSPTRITKNTTTLIDVMITNRMHCIEPASIMELRLSDHEAQLLPILYEHHGSVNARVWKRHFGENNIREFQYLK